MTADAWPDALSRSDKMIHDDQMSVDYDVQYSD